MLALGPIFQQAGIPFVTPGATSPKLPDQIGRHVPRLLRRQRAGGGRRRLRAKKLNGKNAYLLRDNSTGIHDAAGQYFDEAFTKGGGKIIARDDYKTGDKSFTAQITKLKALVARSRTCSTSRPCRTTSA